MPDHSTVLLDEVDVDTGAVVTPDEHLSDLSAVVAAQVECDGLARDGPQRNFDRTECADCPGRG